MMNMHLTTTLDSGFSWTEEVPPGASSKSNESFGYDFGQKVLNIKIAGTIQNLQQAIPYIVGYSETISTVTGKAYDPRSGTLQAPFVLSRHTPAKHPVYQGMYATKILSITGVGSTLRQGAAGQRGGIAPGWGDNTGTAGVYEYYFISILFETPKYVIASDSLMNTPPDWGYPTEGDFAYLYPANGGAVLPRTLVGGRQRPEYMRYTEWDFNPNVEVLARKGQKWGYPQPALRQITQWFVGDRYLKVPKGTLKIKTYDVHVDYVYSGRIFPANMVSCLGKINSLPFPLVPYPDQSDSYPDASAQFGGFVQFAPGTLLMSVPKFTNHAQTHPAALTGILPSGAPAIDYFPRTIDIECDMIYFDPKDYDKATANTVFAAITVTDFEGNIVAITNVPAIGHNLTPLPRPSQTGHIWYTPINNIATFGAFPGQAFVYNTDGITSSPWPNLPVPDSTLLYQYANFENIWATPRKLGTA